MTTEPPRRRPARTTAAHGLRARAKARLRGVVAIVLITAWSFSALSGFLLYAAPTGPRSGQLVLFLFLTKSEWGDIHFWISVLAIIVTALHLVVDRSGLNACARHLVRTERTH